MQSRLEQLRSSSEKTMSNMIYTRLLLFPVILLLSGLAAWFISRPIKLRIRSLTAGVRDMSTGRLDTHIRVTGKDELS